MPVPLTNDLFLTEVRDSTKTTKEILDKFTPAILSFADSGASRIYFGSDTLDYHDSLFRQVVVGKLIDQQKIIAAEVNLKDTLINFYYLDNRSWKQIGSEKTKQLAYTIGFEDMDGDNRNEVITSTFWNMNGNSWKEVYCYSNTTDSIRYAGAFSTDYKIRKDKKQVEETYGGSWYMPISKTLYEWRQQQLVPIREIIISYDDLSGMNRNQTLEYYENRGNDLNGLTLKFKQRYNETNKKQQLLWDNFFNEK